MTSDASPVHLVEDDADDEELTIRGFRRANLKNPIHVVRDGQQAIDYLFGPEQQAPAPVPAVILLDLKLPQVDGLEILKRIRDTDRDRFAGAIAQLGVYWLATNEPPQKR